MDNFDKKKRVVVDLPDTCYSKISMVVLHGGDAEYFLHIARKKSTFFSPQATPPDSGHVMSIFFDALPKLVKKSVFFLVCSIYLGIY